ncbi:lipid II flippase Amj family protein [Bacillus sp. FJAT-49736]|uniref:lipid II flippase Amj family protein n=1 Tax=Bacillus sp. FJAT-49736 TaxID=2833582 RepID=UPI001BCA3588|nr:lipid II flippase Amj family protein [Bacillus sp. FJAT-49736]MBS4174429.1 lipid II flippase Amj family protein [Bacillus sp. FJAT-49736]
MELISMKLIIISLFLLIVTTVETLAYSTRLSGARVGLIASALSLFNTMIIVSRFSTMFQQPMTGKLIGEAPKAHTLEFIQDQYRILIGVTTLGVCIGMLLFPTFIAVFSRAITQLSLEKGSIFAVLKKWSNKQGLKKVIACIRLPRLSYLKGINRSTFPKRIFVVNVLITSIYTVGMLAALYASVIVEPKYAAAAITSSGIINGVATILLTLFVDPKASVLADQVVKKENKYVYLKSYSFAMVSSKLVGTILAQIIFIPAALYIAWFAHWI